MQYIIIKIILFITIFPLYRIMVRNLINSSVRTNISSGDYLPFLLSFNGVGLLFITFIMMTFLISIGINSFIIISSLTKENQIDIKVKDIIYLSIKSINYFFNFHGILLMIYVSIIFPIVGLCITISPMKDFKIPNFITSVIYKNTIYLITYISIILLLCLIAYKIIFSFHYIIIYGYNTKEAIKKSSKLIKDNKIDFFKNL
ncbi:glycerophosphoryl diester phosphodiesterase membrane domain-containing protein [Clostridium perfringens]|nr:glycerophosphoryl diester phosphodiesterase membrane domain-containing protein [Clostridium perfringens]